MESFYLRNKSSEQGSALVLVLLLLAFLSILVADFLYRVRINSYLTYNRTEQIRARFLAQAGISASEGLLLHSSPFNRNFRGNFQNQFINLFECSCFSKPGLFGFTASSEEQEQEELSSDCGAWKLVLEWPVEEDTLRVEISNERARINLNALVMKPMGEEGAQENPDFRPIVSELFKYRIKELGIELTDEEIEGIIDLIVDWLDYGQAGGVFDHDLNDTYQDGDRIYFNKNGPMDTLSELRMIPGITEQIYYALKDYFTVYPLDLGGKNFSFKINLDLANLGVVYAVLRGSSYQGGIPQLSEEEALEYAREIVSSGVGENGFLKEREIPTQLRNQLNKFQQRLDAIPTFRYYRVVSTALTSGGVVYTIEAVMVVGGGWEKPRYLYWREG